MKKEYIYSNTSFNEITLNLKSKCLHFTCITILQQYHNHNRITIQKLFKGNT